jgi:hypothetical protein
VHPELIDAARLRNIDVNDGMIVVYGGDIYYADRAMQLLSTLSSPFGMLNRTLAAFFASGPRSSIAYPYLRGGRRLALKVLGRRELK